MQDVAPRPAGTAQLTQHPPASYAPPPTASVRPSLPPGSSPMTQPALSSQPAVAAMQPPPQLAPQTRPPVPQSSAGQSLPGGSASLPPTHLSPPVRPPMHQLATAPISSGVGSVAIPAQPQTMIPPAPPAALPRQPVTVPLSSSAQLPPMSGSLPPGSSVDAAAARQPANLSPVSAPSAMGLQQPMHVAAPGSLTQLPQMGGVRSVRPMSQPGQVSFWHV